MHLVRVYGIVICSHIKHDLAKEETIVFVWHTLNIETIMKNARFHTRIRCFNGSHFMSRYCSRTYNRVYWMFQNVAKVSYIYSIQVEFAKNQINTSYLRFSFDRKKFHSSVRFVSRLHICILSFVLDIRLYFIFVFEPLHRHCVWQPRLFLYGFSLLFIFVFFRQNEWENLLRLPQHIVKVCAVRLSANASATKARRQQ